MSGGGARNLLPEGCLSLQESDGRERAGFFVYPGIPALLRTARSFCLLLTDLTGDHFSFALKIFPSPRMGAVRISWKKEALWSGAVGIRFFFCFFFGNVHEKDLKEYLSNC